jgi:PAS domain S-box-containing protein
MRKLSFNLFALLLAFSVGALVLFGRSSIQEMRNIAVAHHDDVSWNLSQIEVELISFQNAILESARSEHGELAAVRTRYDIFYSRVSTLSEGDMGRSLRDDPIAANGLRVAEQFLVKTSPLIDGNDETLERGFNSLYQQALSLRPVVRMLALSAVRSYNEREKNHRAELVRVVANVGTGLVWLIALLVCAFVFLIKLYRQGEATSKISESARSMFDAAVSSSLDAVLVVDGRGKIAEFTGAAETVFGYTRAEAMGADMSELIVPEHFREAHRLGMKRFIETGEKKVIDAGRVRLEGLRKSGEVFPVELSISHAKANGKSVFVSFLRDISDELQAEENLRDALVAAQAGEQAKSKLLTVMSHEMRTPLNGILGSMELLDQSNLTDKQKRHLNAIGISGELLLSHVNDVLDLSALPFEQTKSDFSEFDLSSLVHRILDSLSASAKSRNNILTADFLSDELETVRGYETVLQRCLINLLGNAIKFTQNGSIAIEVERLSTGDNVEFRISDTGSGIDPKNLKRIFQEFVTIDSAFNRENEGTGLGLAITKGLIEQCGGTIDVESVLGEGSLFTIIVPLPATSFDVSRNIIPIARHTPDLPENFRSLVVDDNEINRAILIDIVKELGGISTGFNNGFDAIKAARDAQFDVLLLDISMPGIDGIETLRRIRSQAGPNFSTPAIAVTANALPKDHEKIMASGFDGLLVKPLDRSSIRQCLTCVFYAPELDAKVKNDHSQEPDFLRRFGKERFHAALNDVAQELELLIGSFTVASNLSENQRAEAHRLSGSAAILGYKKMWRALQDVENVPDDEWGHRKQDMIAYLRAELDQIVKDGG